MMRSIALIFAAALALSACKPGGDITCPPLQQYSKAEQKAAARELDAIYQVAPTITRMMGDFGATRDAIRKCLTRRK